MQGIIQWATQAVIGLVVGLRSTWRTLLEPKITVLYPLQRVNVSPRWHGLLALPIDPETGNDRCIICFQCERICPDRCIHIEAEGKGKERYLTRFDIEIDKCCYCGLCVEVCPTEAIVFVPHYETSTYNRARLLYSLSDLHQAAPKEPIARGVVGGVRG
ncbi:MAG: NADH-quinone oxidoreductase subunit I [Armatimonadota bacterium]|nr:NADH-quinone oxidoreductase subunit I [Armatimonadota bacterium]MDR5703474.1 NADH-quinone oxidoreductase subunit I [Armatimonadota bacterium]MDR7433633.1 NADH-quinone oxidoreductase subunit I [Armatimonadota bacterium]